MSPNSPYETYIEVLAYVTDEQHKALRFRQGRLWLVGLMSGQCCPTLKRFGRSFCRGPFSSLPFSIFYLFLFCFSCLSMLFIVYYIIFLFICLTDFLWASMFLIPSFFELLCICLSVYLLSFILRFYFSYFVDFFPPFLICCYLCRIILWHDLVCV